MKNPSLNLNDLSAYRTQIMGLATIMIIACHAHPSGVVMPGWLSFILGFGNFGVDIFLLLSGIGLYYSLKKRELKNRAVGGYYKSRIYRVYIPYLFVYIPYCVIFLLLGKYSSGDSLLCLTTLEFWVFHRGAWFVSLIIVLYLFSPFLFKLLDSKFKWLWVALIVTIIVLMCNFIDVDKSNNSIKGNVLFALERVPCFVIGMAIGAECKRNRKVPLWWVIIAAIGYFVSYRFLSIDKGIIWLIIPMIAFLSVSMVKVIGKISLLGKSINLLGNISLESYLTNITVNSLLLALIPAYISSPLFYGRWLEYSIVIVFGVLAAFYVNKYSKRLILKLMSNIE